MRTDEWFWKGLNKARLDRRVAEFDLADTGFQEWLKQKKLTLLLDKSDDALVRRFLKHSDRELTKKIEGWQKAKGARR